MGVPFAMVARMKTLEQLGVSSFSQRQNIEPAKGGQRDSGSDIDSDASGKLKILSEDVEDGQDDDENSGGGSGGTTNVLSEGDERDRRIAELEHENMTLQDKIFKLQSQLSEMRKRK